MPKGPSLLKKREFPDSWVIMFLICIVCAILTYIIPAGSYDIVEGTNMVDPNSFHYTEQHPVGILEFFSTPSAAYRQGMNTIVFISLLSGFLGVILNTGSIDKAIGLMVEKAGDKALLVIPVIMAVMSVLGAVGIVLNTVIAFIPIGLILAKRLNVDPILGVGIMYIGAYSGFASTPVCPLSLLIAQDLAGLPLMSGAWYRCIWWAIIFVVSVWWVMRYAIRVRRDPSRSLMAGFQWDPELSSGDNQEKFSWKDVVILTCFVAVFALYIYGAFAKDWGTDELNALMMILSIVCAVLYRYSPNKYVNLFVAGAKNMLYGVLVIVVATMISVVLSSGGIIHTVIHGLSMPLSVVPLGVAAILMYYINIVINFFIPSASGQAAVMVPIMAPLADIIGMNRQLAVLAIQFGDAMSNSVFPANGTTMGAIAVGKVSYKNWLKFMGPLFLIWTAITTVAMYIGVLINYS